MKAIRNAAEKAKSEPFMGFIAIVDGFRFDIYWTRDEYHCVMKYTPKWGHTHHIYESGIDELINKCMLEIKEGKKYFINGGGF